MNDELLDLSEEGQPTEQPQEDITPDEAAAALAFSTQLGEGMMPQVEQTEEAPTETAPEQPSEPVEEVEQPKPEDIEALVDAKVEEKMQILRDELTAALTEEDEQEE